jgi:RNA ligase (TIGR02306 family)
MPSSLLVKCVRIDEVTEHPDADLLLILKVLGWRCIVRKATDEEKAAGKKDPRPGDLIVYIPPDSVLSEELAEKMKVKPYLKPGNIVHKVRLRGIMSYGLLAPNIWGFKEGEEVADILNITKYIPPPLLDGGEKEMNHPHFPNYSDIENYQNFINIFVIGEEVIATEKIHGTNAKTGFVWVDEEGAHIYMVGSHDERKILRSDDDPKQSLYQYPLTEKMKGALKALVDHYKAQAVVIYGEVYGKVQDLRYGLGKGFAYRAFDISVDGDYLSYDEFFNWCEKFGIETAPLLYRGPFDPEKMKELSEGDTVLMDENPHMREGIVIKPVKERTHLELGRVILKLKGDRYEGRKKATEYR